MAINFLAQLGTVGTTGATNIGPLDAVIVMLQDFGFFRVILPFLLVFAIIYAVLVKTGVLGDASKPGAAKTASSIVALVAAFLVIAYTPVVEAIATILPQASFLIIISVLILMMLTLFGVKVEDLGKSNKYLILIGVVVVVLFVAMLGAALGPTIPALYGFSQFLMGAMPVTGEVSTDTIALIIGAIIIFGIVGGVIYMVTQSGK